MARSKKNVDEDGNPKKGVTYEDVKSDYVLPVSRKDYMEFLEIYHFIRPYLDRELQTTKEELLKKFPKKKAMVEDIWICVHDLKLKWTSEMVNRVFNV